jgi:CHAP domain
MGNIGRAAASGALANVGVTEEGGDNRGRWVEAYQASVGIPAGSPWCAAFVRFRFEQAADKLDLELPAAFPDSGWVPAYVSWAKRSGFWVPAKDADQIQKGDLACFWFPAKGRCAHIGIVVAPPNEDGIFQTVEGNTGPDRGTEVERDGDGVYLKRRRISHLGARGGFIRIPF